MEPNAKWTDESAAGQLKRIEELSLEEEACGKFTMDPPLEATCRVSWLAATLRPKNKDRRDEARRSLFQCQINRLRRHASPATDTSRRRT
jgi:hypothetical protein